MPDLVVRHGDELLRENLAVLARRHPGLVQRLCLPVDSSHVRIDAQGRMLYRSLRNWKTLSLDSAQLARLVAPAEAAEEIFVYGIGAGEHVVASLREHPDATVSVWDRDPWLMRLFLAREELGDVLTSGRLRLMLGADLVHEAACYARSRVIAHPLLASIYRHERCFVEEGFGERRAMVVAGELFVEDLIDALHEASYQVFQLDTKLLSIEEMAVATQTLRPEFIAAINYRNGLAEFCHARSIDLLSWEIDPTRDRLRPCQAPTAHARIFTYRRAQIPEFRAAGFEAVTYLPLATNPKRRFPPDLEAQDDAERYRAGLVFVGASMAEQARQNRKDFLALYKELIKPLPREAGDALIEDLLAEQRKDFSRYIVPELLAARAPDLLVAAERKDLRLDPVKLLAEMAAAEKRMSYLAALGRFGVRVWGDGYWRRLTASGARYMGPAEHFHELNYVYAGAAINVDIGRLYQSDMVTMRVFDVLGCGGFILAEYSEALEDLFEIGAELDAYRTLDELGDKAAWYLAHPDKAQSIARKGYEAVRGRHTIKGRVNQMLASLGGRVAQVSSTEAAVLTAPATP